MTAHATRRAVLLATAAASGLVALALVAPALASVTDAARLEPFALDHVTLGPGPLLDAAQVNAARLRATDPDRLLHMFRVTAGLPSTAEPLGGWEAPNNELRGHFTGHYLSACAMTYASLGDEDVLARGRAVVQGLAACQRANGAGYVSAFPPEFFDRLKRREKVWAPFYTLHKILAGLLDMHTLAKDPQALEVARGLGDWTDTWSAQLDDAHMQAVLDTEFGGMGEALWNLQVATGDARYGRTAQRFEKRKLLDPLARREDTLTGLHANTHIPQAIAAARKAELTGDARSRVAADFFWDDVTTWRVFATGGTSSGEAWAAPRGKLSTELDAYTHECCCTHNMLKLTRHVLAWRREAKQGDYYERAFLNGILGTHHPADGMMMYYVPMSSGWWKQFSDHDHGFWCCDGTGVESFAKLNDSLYFHDARDLYVNLYANSTVEWRERGLTLSQHTDYPQNGAVAITLECREPTALALKLRIPAWADGAAVRVNGVDAGRTTAGDWFAIDRTWRDGDRVELDLPLRLRTEGFADDATQRAVFYGPLVLAGGLGTDGLPPGAPYALPTAPRTVPEFKGKPQAAPSFRPPSSDPASWLKRVPGEHVAFRTYGQTADVIFIPFNQVLRERYGVYWKVTA